MVGEEGAFGLTDAADEDKLGVGQDRNGVIGEGVYGGGKEFRNELVVHPGLSVTDFHLAVTFLGWLSSLLCWRCMRFNAGVILSALCRLSPLGLGQTRELSRNPRLL